MVKKPSSKLKIPKSVMSCRNFDEILTKKLFENLTEKQQIAVYNYFISQEQEQETAISYSDLESCLNNFSINVEGADTSVMELIDNGYSIRQCKEKRKSLGGIAAWLDEGDWKYLGVIYVAPSFRGKGIMGGLLEDGYDGRPITTKVHFNNNIALKAFEKYGFRVQNKEGGYLHLVK